MHAAKPNLSVFGKTYLVLLGMLLLFWGAELKAGHVAGVDISYACINGCTIQVSFRAYRDCSSPITNISPIGTLSMSADSGCVMPTLIGAWLNVSNIDVTPVCPGTPTGCNTPGAVIPGIMEHYWLAEYDFCAANCTNYNINWTTCCRNSSISTLFLPAMAGLYTSTSINPLATPCNSSPVFNSPPILVLCQGQSHIFSQGATDPDGDSLSYGLGPCLQGPGQSVPYLAFTSPIRPLGPGWEVLLDSMNGNLIIRPDPSGSNPGGIETGVLCIYVQEWRNGVLTNTIIRDIQMTVIPCGPNDSPTTLGISNLSGGIGSGFHANTCLGATICFDIRTIDSDLTQTHTVYWNQNLAPLGATFSLSTNPAIQNTIVGQQPTTRFCWTPTMTGTFNFTIVMRDDACPIYGINEYTFTINVSSIALGSVDSITDCKEVSLCALPQDGFGPYSYSWTGNGGLSLNPGHFDSCLVHSYPSSGQFYYQLLVQDSIGCSSIVNDTLRIPSNVIADAGPDDSACSNQPIIIGLPAQPGQNLIYSWGPSIGLTNANSPQPTVVLPNNTTAAIQQTYILTVQDTVTYCYNTDSLVVTVFPTPSSPFNMQDTACQLQQVGFAYLGNNSLNATYNWTFASGNPATATGQGPLTSAFLTPGSHEVTLVVTENGCNSPIERDTIQIIPLPNPNIQAVADQCLAGNSFNFVNFGTFGSTATHNWSFWSNANPAGSTLQNPNGIVFSTAGPKIVSVVTTENGCSSIPDTLLLNVNPSPNAIWTVLGGAQCYSGNSFDFVAIAGNGSSASYSWTFQDGNPAVSSDSIQTVSFGSPGPKLVTLTVDAFGCISSYTDSIMVYPEPSVVAGPDVSFCEGEGGADLLATAIGGTSPYYFTWTCAASGFCGIDSVYDNDPHVNPATSTWYYVNVIDANGCESEADSVYVTIHPKPIVNAGADLVLCGDSAPCAVLMPSVGGGIGPYTYEWIPGTGLNDSTIFNPCARPDTTTIYALVATDQATGCSSEFNTLDTLSTVTVHVNPIPIAEAGIERDICFGDTVQLQGMGSGAGPNYQFQWSPSTGLDNPNVPNPFASPSLTVEYSLVVWSNGCPSYADTTIVHVHTLPSVDAGWDREICLGDSTLLDASAGGDSTAQYSFAWTGATSLNNPLLEDPIASPKSTTTYFVVAHSSWGCKSDSDSVTVVLRPTPIAEAGPNLQVCTGNTIQLQGSYYYGPTDSVANPSQIYFNWSPSASMNDSTLAQPMIASTQSAWYYLSVNYNVCETLDSTFVTVIPELNASLSVDTNRICEGDSIQLQAAGGFGSASFSWEPALYFDDPHSAFPLAFPNTSTVLSLILGESGCFDTLYVPIEVLPSPNASFIHSENSGCAPLSLSLMQTANGANAFIWDFGDGSPVSNAENPVHIFDEAGDFDLNFTAINIGGCSHSAPPLSIHVSEPPIPEPISEPIAPAVLYLPNAIVQLDELNPQSTFWRWDFGDGRQEVGKVQQHQFHQPGSYMIELYVRNNDGCMNKVEIGPFEVRVPELFIPNVFSPNSDGVNDEFKVLYEGNQPFLMRIMDRWGKSIYQSSNKNLPWNGKHANGDQMPEGVYFYLVQIAEKTYTGEVTLMR